MLGLTYLKYYTPVKSFNQVIKESKKLLLIVLNFIFMFITFVLTILLIIKKEHAKSVPSRSIKFIFEQIPNFSLRKT